MSQETFNHVRRAGELVHDALQCVEQTTRIGLVANDTLRESLLREIRGIKVSLSVMNRELTALAAIAHRRKPKRRN
jgi:hypothetical protein